MKWLLNERYRFEWSINNIQSGVFYVNTQGDILDVNPSLIKILGSPSIEATKSINILNFEPLIKFGFSAKLKECIETGKIIYGQGKYKTMWTKLIWITYYFVPILEDNNIVGVLACIEDITEKNKKEEELRKAKEKAEENDRLKSAFLQNLSHEIRTPLNAISGFSGMLNKPELSEEKRKSFISIIQNNSNQLVSIVSDILTISALETKQEKINIDKVCINNIIIDLLSTFKQEAEDRNISLNGKQQLSNKQSEIYTDKTKINQILSNLISNALKFTHQGSIEFGYILKYKELEFYVKDTGIGIKPEFHKKIFERFGQADKSLNKIYGGTGLGLAISKAFVELLGGKIWVQSEPENGSSFYFTIPYKPINETNITIEPS